MLIWVSRMIDVGPVPGETWNILGNAVVGDPDQVRGGLEQTGRIAHDA